ncbi:Tn3 family transposase [Cronobacter dublinensis]|nr:Tn3 family transposase [Cronobacter dublinensis]
MEITQNHTDTACYTEHVFPLMHPLGFSFAPRITDPYDKRLFIRGKTELYLGLQLIISSRSLNKTHRYEIRCVTCSITH